MVLWLVVLPRLCSVAVSIFTSEIHLFSPFSVVGILISQKRAYAETCWREAGSGPSVNELNSTSMVCSRLSERRCCVGTRIEAHALSRRHRVRLAEVLLRVQRARLVQQAAPARRLEHALPVLGDSTSYAIQRKKNQEKIWGTCVAMKISLRILKHYVADSRRKYGGEPGTSLRKPYGQALQLQIRM
ncbi:hypothetical protein FIBSPDRAFT_885559 [Athelia psychrophila]|uniref:Secreted protein n=1 Tax=Athelia psychrophila TaxID=1759441 RepID=A0A166RVP4_9AGAM|nr:hypothetical protein FIBSPDRAFT_885559 [Fibularhizoctonia sp. CBS 109695]